MDTIDDANDMQERILSATIQSIRNRARTMLYTGMCYYCTEEVHSPKLYCDKDCEEFWNRDQRLKKITGGKP